MSIHRVLLFAQVDTAALVITEDESVAHVRFAEQVDTNINGLITTPFTETSKTHSNASHPFPDNALKSRQHNYS